MEITDITNHKELAFYITQLKAEKFRQKVELKNNFYDFAISLNPVSVVNKSLYKLPDGRDVKFDLAEVVLNFGANYFIYKILGKNRSFKGFIAKVLLGSIFTVFIKNNLSKTISEINNLIKLNSE